MHYKTVKGILSNKNGMNLYRGCSHGCIYCDSRSKCYAFTHDFEDIEVKANALNILEEELKKKRKKVMIGTGSMCDPYIPIEKDLKLTRGMLELILKYGHGVSILTKSNLIMRDIDLFDEINKKSKAIVSMTLTTYDDKLTKIIEPNVSTTYERFLCLKEFKKRGIDIGIWFDPILPFINDNLENLEGLLKYFKELKPKYILCFGFGLTLRDGNREYFYLKLDEYFPSLKEKYQRIYRNNYDIKSPNDKKLMKIFVDFCKENEILYDIEEIFKYLNYLEEKNNQLSLF